MKRTLGKIMLTYTCCMTLLSCQNFVNSLSPVGTLDNRIINVRDPIEKTDAATKNYVDNKMEGIEKPPAILQAEGQSETAVMSQKAVSNIISQQRKNLQDHIAETVNKKLLQKSSEAVDPNDITLKTGTYFPKNINLPVNNSSGILENKVLYNEDGSLFCILQYFYRYKENESWKRTYNTSLNGTIVNTWTQWVDTSENAIFNRIYPIGSIYMSVNSTNPSELFGGTWSAWGQGRVPVGVGSNGETNYTNSEIYGGSEQHYHGWRIGAHWYYGLMVGEGSTFGTGPCDSITNGNVGGGTFTGWSTLDSLTPKSVLVNNCAQTSTRTVTANGSYSYGYTMKASSMQPYVTCYMWKRIA